MGQPLKTNWDSEYNNAYLPLLERKDDLDKVTVITEGTYGKFFGYSSSSIYVDVYYHISQSWELSIILIFFGWDKVEEIEKIFFLRLPQNLKNQERHLSSWLELCLKPGTSQNFPPFTPCTIIERTHVLHMQDFNTCKGSI